MKREIIIPFVIFIVCSLLLWFLGEKMYEGMAQQPNTNANQNNEQILNDIQNLQQIEQQLFNSLETNTSLSSTEKQKLITKINDLSTFRINLYRTLGGVNGFFNDALSSSLGTLKEQTVAIGIVESELNKAKKRLEILEEERNNKIRLVEINEYYGSKYEEHAQLMKIIIFMLVPIILLTLLKNKGLLPDLIYRFLIIVIAFIGAVYLWRRYASIITRDNMNYDEYAWSFKPELAPTGGASSSKDPWMSNAGVGALGTCIGQSCCSSGQVYDTTTNKCVDTMPTSTTKEGFELINDVLTKQQPGKYKTDYDLADEFKATLPDSIINK